MRWFLIGAIAGLFLMWTQALAVGGWTGLLAVGEDSLLRPRIEAEIANLTLVQGGGNDGQIYYAVALDLMAGELAEQIPNPELRYSRPVLPVLASLGGILNGMPLLLGIFIVQVVAFGVATVVLELLRQGLGASKWAIMGVLLNPGVWLSLQAVTPDAVALAFCLLAVLMATKRRTFLSIVFLVLGALTKEVFLAFALGLAIWHLRGGRQRAALWTFAAPLCAYALVYLIAVNRVGSGLLPGAGNWTLPFVGIVRSICFWETVGPRDRMFSILALAMILTGIVALVRTRSTLLRCLCFTWFAAALVMSEWVYRFGNASLRVLAPLGTLSVLALAYPGSTKAQQLNGRLRSGGTGRLPSQGRTRSPKSSGLPRDPTK